MAHMSGLAFLTAGQAWTLSFKQQFGTLSFECTLIQAAISL